MAGQASKAPDTPLRTLVGPSLGFNPKTKILPLGSEPPIVLLSRSELQLNGLEGAEARPRILEIAWNNRRQNSVTV